MDHIVSLNLPVYPGVDAQECASIGGLTRLTRLTLNIAADHLPDGQHAAASFTSLQGLVALHLMGTHSGPDAGPDPDHEEQGFPTLEDLDLGPLTQLTDLVLQNVRGGLAAACRVASLRRLNMYHTRGRSNEDAIDNMGNMANLESLTTDGADFYDMAFGLEDLPSLQQLSMTATRFNGSFQDFDGGPEEFLDILRSLTALTRLHMMDCR